MAKSDSSWYKQRLFGVFLGILLCLAIVAGMFFFKTNAQTVHTHVLPQNLTLSINEYVSDESSCYIYFTGYEVWPTPCMDQQFYGNAERIHNGIDDVFWTGSEIVSGGEVQFSNTDQAYNGTRSIYVKQKENDVFQIANGPDLNTSDYTYLVFWFMEEKELVDDIVYVYGWDTGAGGQVGTPVNIFDYLEKDQKMVWQQAIIPLREMSLTGETLDAVRFKYFDKNDKDVKYWLDEISFEHSMVSTEETISMLLFTVRDFEPGIIISTEVFDIKVPCGGSFVFCGEEIYVELNPVDNTAYLEIIP